MLLYRKRSRLNLFRSTGIGGCSAGKSYGIASLLADVFDQSTDRQQAIPSGFLVDVSTDAQKLGLTFPVTVTEPLWEVGVAPIDSMSEKEKTERLRDVLMAFRLRIASQTTLSPLIDYPAMRSMPPGGVPQPIPLFALIQPDE